LHPTTLHPTTLHPKPSKHNRIQRRRAAHPRVLAVVEDFSELAGALVGRMPHDGTRSGLELLSLRDNVNG
jgi:hypothetical protein